MVTVGVTAHVLMMIIKSGFDIAAMVIVIQTSMEIATKIITARRNFDFPFWYS
jgi:hypothetical protein